MCFVIGAQMLGVGHFCEVDGKRCEVDGYCYSKNLEGCIMSMRVPHKYRHRLFWGVFRKHKGNVVCLRACWVQYLR